jgi:energy-coupling factor transporter ATP-binding protein EcfA2
MNIKLQNDIIEWLESSEYWMKLAGHEILQGNCNVDDLVEKCFPFFENDNILNAKPEKREEIKFQKVLDSNQNNTLGKIKLKKIHNIQNVNALTPNQVIEINDSLTVIYGNNGSGKSSYTRLLNNAFNSRGDKALLQNVYSDKRDDKITCDFIFNDGNNDIQRSYSYPNINSCTEFAQFAVFDNKSSKTHLDSENNLLFVPSGFDFFNMKIKFVEALKRKVDSQINSLRKPNPFLKHFINENQISQKIKELNSNTKFSELKQLADFKDTDEKRLDDLLNQKMKLSSRDIAKEVANLERIRKEVENLKNYISRANEIFSEKSFKGISDLYSDYQLCLQLIEEEGFESLKEYQINQIQSKEWKDFIEAGFTYLDIIEKANSETHNHDNQLESCPFCLQNLGEKENKIIEKYKILLKSQAKVNLKKIKDSLKDESVKIERFLPYSFNESNILYQYLHEDNKKELENISKIIDSIISLQKKLITFLDSGSEEEIPDYIFIDDKTINVLGEAIALQIKLKKGFDLALEMSKSNKEIDFFNDKKRLSAFLNEIDGYLKTLKWTDNAESSKSKLNTISITIKQGELYSKYITDEYEEIFAKECTVLNTPKTVEIVQKSSKGQTARRLKIKNYNPSQILSEGEQRSIALADFLTEIQLDENNIGVIFDDPVTSLDDDRRKIIAERLVDLSQQKQVIVFTHDIAFFQYLQSFSKQRGVTNTITTIRKTKNGVGIIHPDLPWITQSIGDRIKFLRNDLVRLKKMEDCGNEDEFIYGIKAWYGLLREGWERGVEERVFNKVIERFRASIETQRLDKISINEDVLNMVRNGMGASEWVHDSSPILNPQIPDYKRASEDLEKFSYFATICKAS